MTTQLVLQTRISDVTLRKRDKVGRKGPYRTLRDLYIVIVGLPAKGRQDGRCLVEVSASRGVESRGLSGFRLIRGVKLHLRGEYREKEARYSQMALVERSTISPQYFGHLLELDVGDEWRR